MTLTHPAALWCLLGLPAVLAIHFLQRRSRREVVTTLFLLQPKPRESTLGHRLERLRSSVPLWLQMLMVLILTWLLAKPQWLPAEYVQRVAVVLDSSASMSAFRAESEAALHRVESRTRTQAARVEWTLLSSDVTEPTLYQGNDMAALTEALPRWQPRLGTHAFTPSLNMARRLVGAEGLVVLITDHPLPDTLPVAAILISVGHEISNVGWTGVTVETVDGQLFWRALLHNHSHSPQERQWQVQTGTQTSPPTSVTLAAGETRVLRAPFPATDELTLKLNEDALALDDQLPILRPQPKILGLHVPAMPLADGSAELREWCEKFAHTRLVTSPAEADVRGLIWPPSVALGSDQHACVFASPVKAAKVAWLTGSIVAEAHPFMAGLNWQSLLVREGMIVPREERDRVLLWQGERPLISLRRTSAGAQQLFCHFDLVSSNARRLPALAVLLHRFLESVRAEKIAPEAVNVDLRQRLVIAAAQGAEAAPLQRRMASHETVQSWSVAQAHLLRAPDEPGFFEVTQGTQRLLRGAAHFADVREADLREARAQENLRDLTSGLVVSSLATESSSPLGLLMLLAALLASWWWTAERGSDSSRASDSAQEARAG